MKLERYVEATYLYNDAGIAEMRNFLLEAAKYHAAAVTVPAFYSRMARLLLKKGHTLNYAAIDVPLGLLTPPAKAFAAADAIRNGADGVEVMANLVMIKEKDFEYLKREALLIRSRLPSMTDLRFVLETSLLTPTEIAHAALALKEGGANGIVTGTAYGKSGVKESDVRLLRKILGPNFFIKASGGIRDLSQVRVLLSAGASRVATARAAVLLEG